MEKFSLGYKLGQILYRIQCILDEGILINIIWECGITFWKVLDSCNIDDKSEINLVDNTGYDWLNEYSLLCHFTNRNK